jgi:hypothetical protein
MNDILIKYLDYKNLEKTVNNVGKKFERELEIRFELDFQIPEILEKLRGLQKYNIEKEGSLIEYHEKNTRKILYPDKKEIIQTKINISKDDFNIQGFPIRISYSHEIEEKEITLIENPRTRIRDRYIIKNFFNAELHLTVAYNSDTRRIQNHIEIEYSVYTLKNVNEIITPLKFLFDLLYVKSTRLLSDNEINRIVNDFNYELKKLKGNLTTKDERNIREGRLIVYEDKPISLLRREIDGVKTNNYFVTNKLNGTRYYLYIIGGTFYLIGRTGSKITTVNTFVWVIYQSSNKSSKYILDGEYFDNGKSKILYYAFDIIFATKPDINLYPYEKRLGYLKQTTDMFKESPMKMKTIFYGSDTYKIVDYMKAEFKEEWDYDNDGLIYTPTKAIYGNISTPTLKWKFDHHQSVDVLVKSYGDNYYECYVNGKDELIKFKDYLLFSPELLVENSIIEVSFDNKTKLFYKLRSRPDKEVPNFIKVANDFWNDITNPIPITDLSRRTLIVTNKFIDWKEYRKYSNSEKDRLIKENIDENNIVLDIGFGKGADISKYTSRGIKNIIAVEPDKNNIKEFFERYTGKYNIIETIDSVQKIVVTVENKYNVEILLINKSGSNPDIVPIINTYLEKIRNGRPLVATMFFSLTYFFGPDDAFVDLINILMEFNPTKILGTFMDGEKTKLFLNKYEWNEAKCGLTLKLTGDNDVFISISESATVSGHNEYLCDFTRLNNFVSYYNYELIKRTFFNFNKGDKNLLTHFSSMNCSFIFKNITGPNIPLNNLINNIVRYNDTLAVQLDSSYFYRCLMSLKDEFSLDIINKNIFDGLFENQRVYNFRKIHKIVKDGEITYNAGYLGILNSNTIDPVRYYYLTGKSDDFFILTYEVPMNDTIKNNIFYNSKANFRLTNVVYDYYFNKEQNDAYQVFNILKENVSKLKDYSIIECNIGVGNYTIIFAFLFKNIICIDEIDLNIQIAKHNIALYHNTLVDSKADSYVINNVPIRFIEKSLDKSLKDTILPFRLWYSSRKSILFVNYQVNRYEHPSLKQIKEVENIEIIVILAENIVPNITDYFVNFLYYKLTNSYVYIITV